MHCQASRFADGLSRKLMMKRSGLKRKPEGASISHNPYITGLQVAANGKCFNSNMFSDIFLIVY